MCVQWMLEIILANSLKYVHKIFKILKYSLELGVTTSLVWLVSHSYVYRIKYKQSFFLCTKKKSHKKMSKNICHKGAKQEWMQWVDINIW